MRGNLIVVVLMLFMGVSVPDAANVCNESKVESYDTDIKYCPEFYAENEKENTTESDSDINSDILEDDSVIGSLNEITKDKSDVTFYDIYESLKSGDVDSTIDMALKVFSDSVIYEVRTSRGLALQIIAVIVLGSTFAQLAGNMGEYVSAHGFMVTYMVLLSLLLGDFVLVQSIVQDTIGDVTEFMKAFYPMYASSVLYVSGPESAGYSQSVIILVIYICQNVIIRFILPLIKCGGLIALINNLGSEDYFSRMAGLMKSLAVWGMRTMFAVVTGINVVKSMIAPSMDRLSRMSTVSAVISVMVSTGEFIRNCMGMACTIMIVILAAVPMIKIIVIMFILRFIAAVVQPVGDKRYAEAAGIMAETVELMLRACGISVMMFIISIALMSVNIS